MVVFYPKILITSSKYKTDYTYKDLPDIPGFILASQVASQNDTLQHSTATVNLKKEELVTNTTAASKYIPRRPRISIN